MRPAVESLETILAARFALSTVAGYGRSDVPAALVVAAEDAPTNAARRRPGTLYRSTRTGGQWLALCDAGYRLHLGTAVEVAAIIDAAEGTAKAAEEASRTPALR